MAKKLLTPSQVKVTIWEERDRLHIAIVDKATEQRTIAEWWDDDARQMFEDGFFTRRTPFRTGHAAGSDLDRSVLQYAQEVGLLAKSNPLDGGELASILSKIDDAVREAQNGFDRGALDVVKLIVDQMGGMREAILSMRGKNRSRALRHVNTALKIAQELHSELFNDRKRGAKPNPLLMTVMGNPSGMKAGDKQIVRNIVSRLSVGLTDDQVAAAVIAKLKKPSAKEIAKVTEYALQCHRANQKQYSGVARGMNPGGWHVYKDGRPTGSSFPTEVAAWEFVKKEKTGGSLGECEVWRVYPTGHPTLKMNPRRWVRGDPRRPKDPDEAVDRQIEQAWYRLASGVQVDIMAIPKIFRDIKLEIAGGMDLDTAVRAAITQYGETKRHNPAMCKNPGHQHAPNPSGSKELQWVQELIETRDATGPAAQSLMRAAGWSPTAVAYVVLMNREQTEKYCAGLKIHPTRGMSNPSAHRHGRRNHVGGIRDMGSINLVKRGGKWAGDTIRDGNILRGIIGWGSFPESEFDAVLRKVSDLGYDLATPLENGNPPGRRNPVEGWAVTHDGETVKTFPREADAMKWMHDNRHGSIDFSVRHEGYDLVLVRGGKVAFSYKRDILQKKRNPLTRPEVEKLLSTAKGYSELPARSMEEGAYNSGRANATAWAASEFGPPELQQSSAALASESALFYPRPHQRRRHNPEEPTSWIISPPPKKNLFSPKFFGSFKDAIRKAQEYAGRNKVEVQLWEADFKAPPMNWFKELWATVRPHGGYELAKRGRGQTNPDDLAALDAEYARLDRQLEAMRKAGTDKGPEYMNLLYAARDIAGKRVKASGLTIRGMKANRGGRWYWGFTKDGKTQTFRSATKPTSASHGHLYTAVTGPFATKDQAHPGYHSIRGGHTVKQRGKSIAQANPKKGTRRKVTMTLEAFARMVKAKNDPKLWKAFLQKVGGWKKWTHDRKSLPKKVTIEQVDVPGVNGMWITYSAGKAANTDYIMPPGSKRKGAWVHEWETMPDLKNDPESGIILTKLRGKSKITDFLHR